MKEILRNLPNQNNAQMERAFNSGVNSNQKSLDVVYNKEKQVFIVQVVEKFLSGVKEQIHAHIRSIATAIKGLKSSTAALKLACQQIISQVVQLQSMQPAMQQVPVNVNSSGS